MLVSAEQEAQLARHKLSSSQISATMRGFVYFIFIIYDRRGVCGCEASYLGPTPGTKLPFSVIRFADRTSPTASEPLGALYNNATGSPGPAMKLHTRAFLTDARIPMQNVILDRFNTESRGSFSIRPPFNSCRRGPVCVSSCRAHAHAFFGDPGICLQPASHHN